MWAAVQGHSLEALPRSALAVLQLPHPSMHPKVGKVACGQGTNFANQNLSWQADKETAKQKCEQHRPVSRSPLRKASSLPVSGDCLQGPNVSSMEQWKGRQTQLGPLQMHCSHVAHDEPVEGLSKSQTANVLLGPHTQHRSVSWLQNG